MIRETMLYKVRWLLMVVTTPNSWFITVCMYWERNGKGYTFASTRPLNPYYFWRSVELLQVYKLVISRNQYFVSHQCSRTLLTRFCISKGIPSGEWRRFEVPLKMMNYGCWILVVAIWRQLGTVILSYKCCSVIGSQRQCWEVLRN